MKKKLITITGLGYVYSPKTPVECVALSGVDFDLYSGEIVSLIGHTGSGKSTLVQLLNGQRKPSSGTIKWENLDVETAGRLNQKKLCTLVGMVFQYPEDQVFEETVYDDIAFGPRQIGKPADQIEGIVLKAADLMGIDRETLLKAPFELSGGTLRKVAIAGVLAMEPQVLVLDEPMAGLDPRSCDVFSGLLKGLRECLDISIVMVSHNLEYVATVSDRIYCIKDGRMELFGTPREVFSDVPRLAGLSVGNIAPASLACFLKERGFDFENMPLEINELAAGILKNYGK